jgi:ribonuclease HI
MTAQNPSLSDAQPVQIKFDGSYLPPDHDEGPSGGIGFIIEDNHGRQLHREQRSLRNFVSSTHIEYQALVAALETVLEMDGVTRVRVTTDSKNIADCLSADSSSTPRSSMSQQYVSKIRTLTAQLDHFRIRLARHTPSSKPRDQNKDADRLARTAHYESEE